MRILLIVYDNDSYIQWFPHGIADITAVLLNAGYEIDIYNQDIHHYSEEHLKSYLDDNKYDVVGLTFIAGYYQYRKALAISEAINNSKNRPPLYIIGGHGPAPEPEFFLKKTGAEVVVVGEGEDTIIELLSVYQKKDSLNQVKGIAYLDGNKCIITERRPLIKDIDSIPWPAYHKFSVDQYLLLRMPHCNNSDFVMPILSGRGCTFKCNFCYRMDKGFRPRSSDSIVEEIKFLQKEYGITYIAFADELLMSSKKRTTEICEFFLRENLQIKWECCGRLNYAEPEILHLMKKSGCVFINYGIESFDDQILENMNKNLTTKQIVKGIESTLAAGISPGYNIIFGNIGETRKTLQKGVDFLLKYDDGAQMRTIRPVTPYPGTPLYYYAIEKGLCDGVADFYENKHLNSDLVAINFTDMTDDELHNSLYDANKQLLENYFNNKKKSVISRAYDLYHNKDVGFRGFRQD